MESREPTIRDFLPFCRGERELTIEEIGTLLKKLGVHNVDFYIGKLQDNSGNRPVYEDFLVEGEAAATLAVYDFIVSMADRPDLKIEFAGTSFCADAKHFRWKDKDQVDEDKMWEESKKERLAKIGGVVEGRKQPWEQILEVAYRKAEQYSGSEPFIIIIRSSSPHNIRAKQVEIARNEIDKRVSSGWDQVFRKLNGFLFFDRDFCQSLNRDAYFYPTRIINMSLNSRTLEALNSIRLYRRIF